MCGLNSVLVSTRRRCLMAKLLVLYGRVAWAHDFVGDPALSAVFQTLPGTNFTVFGAPIPHYFDTH